MPRKRGANRGLLSTNLHALEMAGFVYGLSGNDPLDLSLVPCAMMALILAAGRLLSGDCPPVRASETAAASLKAIDTAKTCAYASCMKAPTGHPNLSFACFPSCRCC
jgi:hypothetical protein